MAEYLIFLPIAYGAWYKSQYDRVKKLPAKAKDESSEAVWMHDNLNAYLDEGPLTPLQFAPGDQYEYELYDPQGPITDKVERLAGRSQDQLMAIADHSRTRETLVMGLAGEYFKPRQELLTRDVDQPRTLVSLVPGGYFDELINTGVRYWDRPVPRSTGIDRYYPNYYANSWIYKP